MSSATRRRSLFSLLALVVTFALVACGGDDDEPKESGKDLASLSAEDLLDESIDALHAVDAFAIDGSADDEDEGEFRISMEFVDEDASGTMTADRIDVDLLRVDGEGWFSAPEEFWVDVSGAPQEIADQISDRWISLDADDRDFKDLLEMLDRDAFVTELLDPSGELDTDGTDELDGTDVLLLTSTNRDGDVSTLYIDAETALPLLLVSEDGNELTFEYDENFKAPKPPRKSEVLDLEDLQQLG